jgi:hypothetical protein
VTRRLPNCQRSPFWLLQISDFSMSPFQVLVSPSTSSLVPLQRLSGSTVYVTKGLILNAPFAKTPAPEDFRSSEFRRDPVFLPLAYSSLLGQCLRLVSYATGALPHLRLRTCDPRPSLPPLCFGAAGRPHPALRRKVPAANLDSVDWVMAARLLRIPSWFQLK